MNGLSDPDEGPPRTRQLATPVAPFQLLQTFDVAVRLGLIGQRRRRRGLTAPVEPKCPVGGDAERERAVEDLLSARVELREVWRGPPADERVVVGQGLRSSPSPPRAAGASGRTRAGASPSSPCGQASSSCPRTATPPGGGRVVEHAQGLADQAGVVLPLEVRPRAHVEARVLETAVHGPDDVAPSALRSGRPTRCSEPRPAGCCWAAAGSSCSAGSRTATSHWVWRVRRSAGCDRARATPRGPGRS